MGYYKSEVRKFWPGITEYKFEKNRDFRKRVGGEWPFGKRIVQYILGQFHNIWAYYQDKVNDDQYCKYMTPSEYIYALVDYGIGGLSASLQNIFISVELYRQRDYRLVIKWSNGDGFISCDKDDQIAPLSVKQEFMYALSLNYFGDPPNDIKEIITDKFVSDLRSNKVSIPWYELESSSNQESVYRFIAEDDI